MTMTTNKFYVISNFFITITEIDLGSIENGSAASDLPPEGPKKERWADLTHLAHVEELANFRDFAHLADVLNITSPAEGVPT